MDSEDIHKRDLKIDEQKHRIAGLTKQVETLLDRERDLRTMLLETHEQVIRRDEQMVQSASSPRHGTTASNGDLSLSATASAPVLITASATANTRPFGVNIAGNITSEKGVGEGVRGQARSLSAVDVPIVLNNVVDESAANGVNEFAAFTDDNPYAVNLIHLNADALPDFVEARGKEYFRGHYNIGCWFWETSTFPDAWRNRFQYLDEIWVGSDFVLDAISRVSPIPVIKVPLTIPDRSSLSAHPRAHFGLDAKTFVFLFAFDYMSIAQRKNPLGLIEAFRKAFRTRDDVTLVLKSGHSEAHPLEAKLVKDACRGANIKLMDTLVSRHELNSLMKAADCYVSLHRSEGFGLTLAEAMSLGKPVIATAYSGNMDFMTPANSYLVRYELAQIDKPYGPYQEGEWANPDLDHAAELMRSIYKDQVTAREVGRRARADILDTLNPLAAGTPMRNRLLRIADFGKIASPGTESQPWIRPASNQGDLYLRLIDRIHRIVEANIPTGARVVVISKGDENLLTFGDRTGWHFPQDPEGKYAGYHPGTDSEAIRHLEALRQKGGQYLLFPQTAFWWLDHYSEFRSHLESRYTRLWSDPDCVIYGLSQKATGMVSRFRERIVAAPLRAVRRFHL